MKTIIYILFLITFFHSTHAQNQYKVDSLKKRITATNNDSIKTNMLLEIGTLYEDILPDTAISYFNQALFTSKHINNKNLIAACYKKIGNSYYYKSNFEKSLFYYQKALSINTELDNKQAIANNIGNIGNIYYYQKDYQKAIDYYKKALQIQKDNNDKKGMSYSNINIGNIYSIKNNFNKALLFYKNALKLQKEIGDSNGIALNYINIGTAYESKKEYNKAISYYHKSLKIYKNLNNQRGIANNYLSLSVLYNTIKQYNKAINYAQKGIDLSKKIGNLRIQKDIYNNLSDIYINLKHYQKSLEYKDTVILLNDSIFSIEKLKAITNFQTLYETEKKQKLILQQKYELKENKLKLLNIQSDKEQQQKLLIIFIIGFVFLLISIIIIHQLFKQKVGINKELIETNEELNVLLSTINKQTAIIKESEEKFKVLINSINDAIILVDNNENIILWNNTAERMFGFAKKEALNKNVHQLITPKKYRDKAHKSFAFFKKSGKGDAINKTIELEGINEKNEAFPIELSLSAIKINNKWHAIGSVRNISERKRQEIELINKTNEIKELYKDIMDNIKFAKTIQQALLPSESKLNSMINNYCLYYNPKDIVGGDFYFVEKEDNILTFAIADGTGHGVSGAFISILGITFLSNIVSNSRFAEPSKILSLLRKKVKETFKSFGNSNNNGMDIALCKLNIKAKTLDYSGAFIPLRIIRNNKIIKYRASRTSIGNCPNEIQFEENKIKLKKGDIIYLFTDGFADQFGGNKNKKFKTKQLEELLIEIKDLTITEQKEILIQTLNKWKGNYEQTDDITFWGLRI